MTPNTDTEIRPKRATKKAGGQSDRVPQRAYAASPTNTSEEADVVAQPNSGQPLAGSSIVDGQRHPETRLADAVGNPIPDTADSASSATTEAPHLDTIAEIIELHRRRQGAIKARTKLALQMQAVCRLAVCLEQDYVQVESDPDDPASKPRRKLTKGAEKRVADALAGAVENPGTPLGTYLLPYRAAMKPLEEAAGFYEKRMVKLAKTLPVYVWVKSIKGLGDTSFATIVGECGDIGSYKSVSAVWKRMGLAVIGGNAQGRPGKGASADDWIEHGYNRARRSVSWNARKGIIGAMGLFRPLYGEDVQANAEYTYYQRVFAERARYEAIRLPHKDGTQVKMSDSGKESYSAHCVARAFRYTEKRLLKHLYLRWNGLTQVD